MRANEAHTVHDLLLTRGQQSCPEQCLPTSYGVALTLRDMNIGNRIKRLREDANLTQRQLATTLGCSFGLVAQWESHRKLPGRDNLKRIADALAVDVGYLLSGSRPNGVHVTDPQQLLMLRRFRNLSPRQRENVLELLGVSGDVRRQIEKQR